MDLIWSYTNQPLFFLPKLDQVYVTAWLDNLERERERDIYIYYMYIYRKGIYIYIYVYIYNYIYTHALVWLSFIMWYRSNWGEIIDPERCWPVFDPLPLNPKICDPALWDLSGMGSCRQIRQAVLGGPDSREPGIGASLESKVAIVTGVFECFFTYSSFWLRDPTGYAIPLNGC